MEQTLPSRKPTRLKDFDYSQNAAYFITICTAHKSKILCNIVGGDDLGAPCVQLTGIGKIVQKYISSMETIGGLCVQKYVIMPNHIHLLLLLSDDGAPRSSPPTAAKIPRAIAALKRFVNNEVGKNIWQRSYHDHVIRGKEDYQMIWQYIDQNPLKWSLDKYYCE